MRSGGQFEEGVGDEFPPGRRDRTELGHRDTIAKSFDSDRSGRVTDPHGADATGSGALDSDTTAYGHHFFVTARDAEGFWLEVAGGPRLHSQVGLTRRFDHRSWVRPPLV